MKKPKKIILLGSGALKIGEAGEFDYSGSQAIKAMKEEGIQTILINPNIATIQTSKGFADKIYFLPVNPYFVEKVIQKEKPDGILLSFGGQTALNCGVELYEKGILKKHNVKVLGTQVQTIINTEDRDLFVKKLNEIGLKTPRSKAVSSVSSALSAARKIGYPIMIRIAYALGGLGSGMAKDEKELKKLATKAFAYTKQILVEEYLKGWKEVEYEVVRDRFDNCITVCNMENFDPMGIHTGESIVVAPSQTLTNHEYHKLREISIKAIKHLGIVGECNIQFAFSTKSDDYRIIEVNARLSRSSALASKATGYPLAFVAAKLSLGYALTDIPNSITKVTTSCFEPALDYIVVKIPRWDLKKFKEVSKEIGSGMKSVGEIMAIGKTFEETIQKAIRMLGVGMHGIVCNNIRFDDVVNELKRPTDERIFAIVQALKSGMSVEKINKLTNIDRWFLYKIRNIVMTEKELEKHDLSNISKELMQKAKQQGFSDFQIARKLISKRSGFSMNESVVKLRSTRKKMGVVPFVKQIDTLAAEYPAKTNYLYLTYNGTEDDITFSDKNKIVMLGSGAYRIGSSVEFDWCCVTSVLAMRKMHYSTIMINCNPETVSTDYDICDKLYFDELSFERVMDIYEKENPKGVIVSMGGQIPNNLAMRLHKQNVRILGTHPEKIDSAEDRHKFSKLLDQINVDQPEWEELTNVNEAKKFAKKSGYPVLVRPSYVLSGAAMSVAFDDKSLVEYLSKASDVSKEHPVVISKFILGAKEIECDAVAKDGEIIVHAITEHVENAGVHSGDATMVLPPQKTYLETVRRVEEISRKIAKELKITGPFNIQFLAKDNHIKVIECNLRASRSFPFVSKILKTNFIDIATKAMLNKPLPKINIKPLDYVGVKSPQFSFSRLSGADPLLGVEMSSTGEVGCMGKSLNEAFLKSILSSGFKMPEEKNVLVSISGDKNRYHFLDEVVSLKEMGFNIFATEHTSEFLNKNGIKNEMIYKAHNLHKQKNVLNYMEKGKLDLVIAIPNEAEHKFSKDHYMMRRAAVDFAIPLFNNLQVAKLFVHSIYRLGLEDMEIKSWEEY